MVVEAIIDKEGCVTHVRALQGLPHGLTESAENAVRHWVFKPATIAGAPVKVYYVLTVNFSVQSDMPVAHHAWCGAIAGHSRARYPVVPTGTP